MKNHEKMCNASEDKVYLKKNAIESTLDLKVLSDLCQQLT